MGWDLYLRLSALMFLEFAVWGAWYPVLAARLLGPLKFSGKQTGWIYATIPLGSIFMPLVAGHFADQRINTELILAGAHLIGAFLLFIAAWKKQFSALFVVMMLYALCFAGTIPLVNSLMFHHLKKNGVDPTSSVYIFMWAPIAWALAGYFLSGWRWIFKTGGDSQFGDAEYAACKDRRAAGTSGIRHAQQCQLSGLHHHYDSCLGNHAVLFPRDRAIHAGQWDRGQERACGYGRRTGGPGAGDLVPPWFSDHQGRLQVDHGRRAGLVVAVVCCLCEP